MNLIIDGPVATIRFSRPEAHNRIEPADLDKLEAHLQAVEERREIRVLILASTGKTFSAGFHLGAIGEGAPGRFEAAADRLARCRTPSIAALQGSVYGGAADLALACDFRIGVESVELMVPPVRLGIPYYASGVERFATRLTPGAAKRIFLAGETLNARELFNIGYLDEIVAADALEARVAKLAEVLASGAPLAMEAMKRMLNDAACSRLDRSAASKSMRECLASEDHKEGLAAMLEKRLPDFRGR